MGIAVVGRFWRCVKLCRMMSSSSRSRSVKSPWLMLYPHYKNKEQMAYRFLRLKDNKVVSFDKRGGDGDGEMPANGSKIVGSSQGWLALFNDRNSDLFLSDPINHRHMKLPSINTLPDPATDLLGGGGTVSKLILSCSPLEPDCCAMMSYGAGDWLAVCSPARSSYWTPIGGVTNDFSDYFHHAKVYTDFVFCSRRKRFICVSPCFKISLSGESQCYEEFPSTWEHWDASGLNWIDGDNMAKRFEIDFSRWRLPDWVYKDGMRWKLDDSPVQISYLVYAEESDQLYLVVRYIDGFDPYLESNNLPFRINGSTHLSIDFTNPLSINNPYLIHKLGGGGFRYRTVGFVVFKFHDVSDLDNQLTAVDSLDGLAMFVGGVNHSFAISASKYPESNLKPNSIYFSDDGRRFRGPTWAGTNRYGGLDAGIFDYRNNVISPVCHHKFLPRHYGSPSWIRHAPVWFTPKGNSKTTRR